jgi:predicted ATPase
VVTLIEKITLDNFKAFKHAEFEIKPITILVGPNNGGKSSLMQSIGLIQQTLRGSGAEILKFSDFIDLRDFDTAIHQNFKKKEMHFRFEFEERKYFDIIVEKKDDGELSVKNFSCDNGKFEYIIEEISPKKAKTQRESDQYKAKKFQFNSKTFEKYKKLYQNIDPVFYKEGFFFKVALLEDRDTDLLKFLDEHKLNEGKASEPETSKSEIELRKSILEFINFHFDVQKISSDFYQSIKQDFEKIKYIGPIRALPNRFYEIRPFGDVGVVGEHAVQILGYDSMVRKDLEEYFKNMEIADSLQVSIEEKIKSFSLKFKTKTADKGVNYVDMGTGTAQILPILVQSLIKPKKESLILIEQPEVHLHPKVQADLADFFIKVASKDRRFLLETHSDYFIERIRYDIIDGVLSPENVAIYYIEQDEAQKSSTVKKIELNSKGQYSNLPDRYVTNFRLEETRKMTKKLLEKI